jgi:hypothetical protein
MFFQYYIAPNVTTKIKETNPDLNVGRKMFQFDLTSRLIESLRNMTRYSVVYRSLVINETANLVSLNVSIKQDGKYIKSQSLVAISDALRNFSLPFMDSTKPLLIQTSQVASSSLSIMLGGLNRVLILAVVLCNVWNNE